MVVGKLSRTEIATLQSPQRGIQLLVSAIEYMGWLSWWELCQVYFDSSGADEWYKFMLIAVFATSITFAGVYFAVKKVHTLATQNDTNLAEAVEGADFAEALEDGGVLLLVTNVETLSKVIIWAAAQFWDQGITLAIMGETNVRNGNDAGSKWYVFWIYVACILIFGSLYQVGLFKLREKITSKVAAQSRAASTYSSDLILGFNGVVLAWVFALAVNTSVDQTIQNFTDLDSANADDTSKSTVAAYYWGVFGVLLLIAIATLRWTSKELAKEVPTGQEDKLERKVRRMAIKIASDSAAWTAAEALYKAIHMSVTARNELGDSEDYFIYGAVSFAVAFGLVKLIEVLLVVNPENIASVRQALVFFELMGTGFGLVVGRMFTKAFNLFIKEKTSVDPDDSDLRVGLWVFAAAITFFGALLKVVYLTVFTARTKKIVQNMPNQGTGFGGLAKSAVPEL